MTINEKKISEITLIRLPSQLSEAVDKAVEKFEEQRESTGVSAYIRWHDADLWMLFQDQTQSETPAIVTRRVTVAAYSSDPDLLMFIPDVTKTTSEGRFIQPAEERGKQARDYSLSILKTMRPLWIDRVEKDEWLTDTEKDILTKLGDAWDSASRLDSRGASQLLV